LAYLQCFFDSQANPATPGRLLIEPLVHVLARAKNVIAGQHEAAALPSYTKSYQTTAPLGTTL